ncbi:MAG: SIMPL domain-containing protein, partial [Chloroflexota bacterium]
MLRTLHLSTVGRLSLAVAVFLALLAVGALMAARSANQGSAASKAAGGAGQEGILPHLAGFGASEVLAQGVPTPAGALTGIAVQGEGEATAAPDMAFVTLGVQTEAQTAKEALDQNSAAMAAVINAVKGAGIPENKIQTAGVNLLPISSRPRPDDPTPPRTVG